MQEMKNPAGQEQGFETESGCDPIICEENVKENNVFVKNRHVPACHLNPLFMPSGGNTLILLQRSSLPNRTTQQGTEMDTVDLLKEAYFARLDKWAEHTRKSRKLLAELECIKTELIEALASADAEMTEAKRLQRLAHGWTEVVE